MTLPTVVVIRFQNCIFTRGLTAQRRQMEEAGLL